MGKGTEFFAFINSEKITNDDKKKYCYINTEDNEILWMVRRKYRAQLRKDNKNELISFLAMTDGKMAAGK